MFGGIIRQQGKLIPSNDHARRGHLRILAPNVTCHLSRGDSIAVDGVCLTVTHSRGGVFGVDVTAETMRRTNFSRGRHGWWVNLELPIRMKDRIHGHPVLGHVDGVGYVKSIRPEKIGAVLDLLIPWKLAPYMAEKGSVAVNGVSLTIARRRGRLVRIALIPETLRRTNLRFLKFGACVNLEVDVLARYARLARGQKKGTGLRYG